MARQRLSRLLTLLVCIVATLPLLVRVWGMWSSAGMQRAFYYDDFYYYAQVARNIRDHGISSFDGVTLTNGYQPLWMLIVLALSFFSPIPSEGFFLLLFLVSLALHAGGTWRLRRLLMKMFAGAPLIDVATVFYFFLGLLLAVSGMEVVTLFFLLPFLIASWRRLVAAPKDGEAAWFGFLCALAILGRLDAIFLMAMLFLAAAILLLPRSLGAGLRAGGVAGLACAAPIGLYLLSNLAWFGVTVPVSGLAKSLRIAGGLSWKSLQSAIVPKNLLGGVMPLGCDVLVLAALFVLLVRRPRGADKGALFSILLFPPVFFFATALRSDWLIWPWYFYSLIFAAPFAMLITAQALPSVPVRWSGLLALTVALLMCAAVMIKTLQSFSPFDDVSLDEARALKVFATNHPGRYGMGDAAGLMGFLIGRPVVQLEGLVADREMLGFIGRSAPLRETLAHYVVRYYATVAIGPSEAPSGGCWSVADPDQAGPLSPRMHARACGAPLLDFTSRSGRVTRRLMVFDVAALKR